MSIIGSCRFQLPNTLDSTAATLDLSGATTIFNDTTISLSSGGIVFPGGLVATYQIVISAQVTKTAVIGLISGFLPPASGTNYTVVDAFYSQSTTSGSSIINNPDPINSSGVQKNTLSFVIKVTGACTVPIQGATYYTSPAPITAGDLIITTLAPDFV